MTSTLRTHVPSLLAAGVFVGLFCVGARQFYGGEAQVWSLDLVVVSLLLPATIFIGLFLAAHVGMVVFGRAARWAYAVAGAVATSVAFAVSVGQKAWETSQQSGTITIAIALPALLGALLGSLYYRGAGVAIGAGEAEGFDAAAAVGAPVHLQVASAEYFAGPLQVRTSLPAMVLTGVGAGVLFAVLTFAFLSTIMFASMGPAQLVSAWAKGMGNFAIGYGAASIAVGAVLLPLPVLIGHLVCRGRGWTSHSAYAGVGAVLGLATALLGAGTTSLLFAFPCAAALAFYRYLVGLEPKALPEDIVVADRRTLVGADHARRRYNRIVGG